MFVLSEHQPSHIKNNLFLNTVVSLFMSRLSVFTGKRIKCLILFGVQLSSWGKTLFQKLFLSIQMPPLLPETIPSVLLHGHAIPPGLFKMERS